MRRVPTMRSPTARAHPLDVLAAWPHDRAVMMLHSGRVHPQRARWSIIAPPSGWLRVVDGQSTLIGDARDRFTPDHDPLHDLDAALRSTARSHREIARGVELPFHGGWIGYLSYELGSLIEPCARSRASPWPVIELAHCPAAIVFDHVHRTWHLTGEGDGEALDELESILHQASSRASSVERRLEDRAEADYALGDLQPLVPRDKHVRAITRALEYIAAGDIYQANITQQWACEFFGSPRALAIDAFRRARPWYGAYLEGASIDPSHAAVAPRHPAALCMSGHGGPRRSAIISLSPELFLEVDPGTGVVTTRPIKGTLPASRPVCELIDSAKDAAELHMIVDLMRNDLGRVCEYGSVQVIEPRGIETHPTVHQGVAEITGRLRAGVGAADLLRATFPGGSVTGVPKIRAMQIIDELEQHARGPYCGAIGYFSDCGRSALSIAIRTLMLRGDIERAAAAESRGHVSWRGRIEYGAGGGIVADSVPQLECDECLVKCRVLTELIAASREPAAAPAR